MTELHARFAAEVAEHRGILLQLAHAYGARGPDRADLVQEMLLQLWRAYPGFDPARGAAFSTWMYRVALNVAISAHRHQQRRAAEHLPLEDFGLELAEAERFWDQRSDNMRTLDALIAALGELDRALILLFIDGREPAEMAGILGLSVSNVSTRVTRLRHKLQTQFAAATVPARSTP